MAFFPTLSISIEVKFIKWNGLPLYKRCIYLYFFRTMVKKIQILLKCYTFWMTPYKRFLNFGDPELWKISDCGTDPIPRKRVGMGRRLRPELLFLMPWITTVNTRSQPITTLFRLDRVVPHRVPCASSFCRTCRKSCAAIVWWGIRLLRLSRREDCTETVVWSWLSWTPGNRLIRKDSPRKSLARLYLVSATVAPGAPASAVRCAGPTRLRTRFSLHPPATAAVNYSKNHNSYSLFHRRVGRALLRAQGWPPCKHLRLRF